MLRSLTDETASFTALRSHIQSGIRTLQSGLEFKVDVLAHRVHVLDQRAATAGKEADRILALSAARLKEREDREKSAAGTRDMPTMEVLRSLATTLPPEEDGGGG